MPGTLLRKASAIGKVGTCLQHTTCGVQPGPDLPERLELGHPTYQVSHLHVRLWSFNYEMDLPLFEPILYCVFEKNLSQCNLYIFPLFDLYNFTFSVKSYTHFSFRAVPPKQERAVLFVNTPAHSGRMLRFPAQLWEEGLLTSAEELAFHLQSMNLQTCSATGQITQQDN